jgi:uncharacterized membrane protein
VSVALVILRLLHVVLGAFWVGTFIFVALFLSPSVAEAGPDGSRVMAGVQRRGFMQIMPLVGLVTMLTGLWFYWRDSGGFTPAWSRTPMGMAYSAGALAAVVAFTIGLTITRPTTIRIGELAGRVSQTADPTERDALLAQLGALRKRSSIGSRLVALLLTLATAFMAVARYL